MNVYDFDKTIYDGDSTADFYFYCLLRHPRMVWYVPRAVLGAVRHYILHSCSKTQFKEQMYSFLNAVDYKTDVLEFWAKNAGKIKPWYKKQARYDDVVISASPRFLLAPLCSQIGIRHLIASEVDGRTGMYTGKNCHGQEKVRRFYAVFPKGKIDAFYSDSQSDLPLAILAKKSYLVRGQKLTQWQ